MPSRFFGAEREMQMVGTNEGNKTDQQAQSSSISFLRDRGYFDVSVGTIKRMGSSAVPDRIILAMVRRGERGGL